MVTALVRGFGHLFEPGVRRYLLYGLLLAVACFAATWALVAWLLTATALTSIGWIDTVLDVLGGLATLVLTWLLFPTVFGAMCTLFTESVVAAVERRHHGRLGEARGAPVAAALLAGMRLLALGLALNVLLLPLLFLGPVYPVAWVCVQGLLLGREYFELVALRRLPPAEAAALRRQCRGSAFGMGAVAALLLMVPFVNLLVPFALAGGMVHLVHDDHRS